LITPEPRLLRQDSTNLPGKLPLKRSRFCQCECRLPHRDGLSKIGLRLGRSSRGGERLLTPTQELRRRTGGQSVHQHAGISGKHLKFARHGSGFSQPVALPTLPREYHKPIKQPPSRLRDLGGGQRRKERLAACRLGDRWRRPAPNSRRDLPDHGLPPGRRRSPQQASQRCQTDTAGKHPEHWHHDHRLPGVRQVLHRLRSLLHGQGGKVCGGRLPSLG
jgi:hypothetical protein